MNMIEEEAAQSITGFKPQENTSNQHSTSFSFSLQIRTEEGLSIRGDMTMQKTVPQRASKPVTVAPDVEQEYDDDNVNQMPRSALRFRSTQTQTESKPRTTGPIVTPVTQRVSGSTRLLLWVVLILGIAFLVNGLVLPAISSAIEQVRYGDAKIATYDLDNHHWITEESNGRVRIVVSLPDGSHSQQLTSIVGGVPNHALVTLDQTGNKIEVSINGTYANLLISDGKGGYKWGNS